MNTIPSARITLYLPGPSSAINTSASRIPGKETMTSFMAHQDFVNPSAKIPGERTDKNTNGSAEQQCSESDEEGCTGSF